MDRDPSYERDEEVTEVRREREVADDRPPPPWWRENWWIWGLLLLLFVGALIAFFALRDRDDDERATATVPELIGLQEQEAVGRVEERGLEPEVRESPGDEPAGTVIDQSPEPGAEVETGTRVLIIVSEEEPETETETETETEMETETVEPETVQVPDVLGLDHVEAGADVDDAGLVANTFAVPSDEERGTVLVQNPDSGTEVDEGSTVRLNVSLGPGELGSFEVPDVTGLNEAEARDRCRRARFTCLTVDRDAPSDEELGEVIDQRPAAGTMAEQLSQIRLFVGR